MIRVLMHGCNGKMGQVVTGLIEKEEDMEIVAGVDVFAEEKNGYPVFETIGQCDAAADVVIDFSNAGAVDALLDACEEKGLPVVLCTTGLSDAQLGRVQEAARKTAILRSANMSLGVNLLLKLAGEAAKVLAPSGFDMEIVEKHHNQKVDAPSGTALALADAMSEGAGETCTYTYDRSQKREKRKKDEIGISSVRGGTIVGEHELIYAGEDEVIEIKHTAYSRSIFGKGAVAAARFLAGKPAGLYDMSDVIGG